LLLAPNDDFDLGVPGAEVLITVAQLLQSPDPDDPAEGDS
jgi:hypothetical protein